MKTVWTLLVFFGTLQAIAETCDGPILLELAIHQQYFKQEHSIRICNSAADITTLQVVTNKQIYQKRLNDQETAMLIADLNRIAKDRQPASRSADPDTCRDAFGFRITTKELTSEYQGCFPDPDARYVQLWDLLQYYANKP